MKFKIFLIFCMLCAGAISGRAQSGDTGDLHWELADSVLTISGTGAMPDYSPNNAPWKDYRDNIITVDIQNGVTNIGGAAFAYYNNLSSVNIPNSVTNIESWAFWGCSNLIFIAIPNSVTNIGGAAFCNCKSLSSFTIPNSVTSIRDSTFSLCTNLISATIPNSVASIEGAAFAWCNNLQNITVEWSTPISIPANVFAGVNKNTCILHVPAGTKSLYQAADVWKDFGTIVEEGETTSPCDNPIASGTTGSLTWTLCPDSTLTISGTGAMPDYSLDNVPWKDYRNNIIAVIQTGVTSIGNYAFSECSNLVSVTIPNGVTSIGMLAFCNCFRLASIIIPEGVISIGNSAFQNVPFTSINIPASLINLGDHGFPSCPQLTSINVDNANPNFSSETGILYNKDKTTLIQYPAGKTETSFSIPNSVTKIGPYAFSCPSLTSVTIPNSVTIIEYDAFTWCSNLTSIIIPNSVTKIGNSAFAGCRNLQTVEVEWEIPLNIVDPLNINTYAFSEVTFANATLIVPSGTKATYQAADVWKFFGTIVEATVAVTSVRLNKTTLNLLVNATEQLTATVLPDNATNKNATWNSTNESVATVSTTGLVTAKAAGYTFIFVDTEDGNKTDSCVVTVTRASSGDATLSSLTVDKGTLNPAFDSNVTSYTVSVENTVTSIILSAIANDTTATVSGAGTKTLSVGENVFDIIVTAEDGTEMIYTVTVTRALSSDATLSSLTVNQGTLTPAFDSSVTSYTVSVENAVTSITFSATANDTSASISGDGTKTLNVGNNVFDIIVTAEDGTEMIYTVTVTRALSSDATLSSLTVNQGTLTPAFDSSVTSYTVSVENAVTSIILTATANDVTASVSGDGTKTLNVGENVFEIVVTAENGTQQTYTVTVTRLEPEVIAVTSISLDKTSLELSVDSTAQLTATVLPENAANKNVSWSSTNESVATVSSSGLVTAKAAGTATITVTSEDGNLTAECLVTVQKPEETIVVEETKPAGADGNGTIELSLNIPSDASFVGFFYMEFPSGLVLNQMLTALVMELVPYYDLTISLVSEGKWLFVIRQKTLRGKQDLTYSKIMNIVYHVEEGTEDGAYEVEISDLKFDFDDGTTIEIPELSVPVTIDQTYTGIRNASSEKPTASVKDNMLRVKSPVSERISVYSTNGILLYMNDKQAGEAFFNIGPVSDKILIVKGNSGWVKKVNK